MFGWLLPRGVEVQVLLTFAAVVHDLDKINWVYHGFILLA